MGAARVLTFHSTKKRTNKVWIKTIFLRLRHKTIARSDWVRMVKVLKLFNRWVKSLHLTNIITLSKVSSLRKLLTLLDRNFRWGRLFSTTTIKMEHLHLIIEIRITLVWVFRLNKLPIARLTSTKFVWNNRVDWPTKNPMQGFRKQLLEVLNNKLISFWTCHKYLNHLPDL